ncbi:hypothetical protein BU15DRAFT_42516 [Melanogaster broomeanus]|nr:hypothetical protein BU15DRAFT_42516 [Melanogaster broomeanus]
MSCARTLLTRPLLETVSVKWWPRRGLGSRRFATSDGSQADTGQDPTCKAYARTPNPTRTSSLTEVLTRALFDNNHSPGGLRRLIQQYDERSDQNLDIHFPAKSESGEISMYNAQLRRGQPEPVLIVHAVHDGMNGMQETLCSGFAVGLESGGQSVIVTCAHTLEEIRSSPVLALAPYPSDEDVVHRVRSGSWIISDVIKDQMILHPVQSILTAVRRPDVMLLAVEGIPARSLPVSHSPAPVGSTVFAHFVTTTPPPRHDYEWQSWIGGTWRMWQKCTVTGYQDHLDKMGTVCRYDHLSRMTFHPAPPPGSSGGPIVDSNGTVVGVILGTMSDYGKTGLRGLGIQAQFISHRIK